ncbi:hypothetical protein EVAR_75452_1 [Eumeta japonica]|uniref:Uncharacterized protein n=1 Tax=Eumeta variegata TaxID=151549 RepID=A0A4C1TMK2_EUMVA|nr:hypothetical protein EVAR_75452_1 [Eumeta japonica]
MLGSTWLQYENGPADRMLHILFCTCIKSVSVMIVNLVAALFPVSVFRIRIFNPILLVIFLFLAMFEYADTLF